MPILVKQLAALNMEWEKSVGGFQTPQGLFSGALYSWVLWSLSLKMTAWGSFDAGASSLMSWGQQVMGVAMLDNIESFWAAGDVEMAGTVVLDAVEERGAGTGKSKCSGTF
jgi:hypothetical protein